MIFYGTFLDKEENPDTHWTPFLILAFIFWSLYGGEESNQSRLSPATLTIAPLIHQNQYEICQSLSKEIPS